MAEPLKTKTACKKKKKNVESNKKHFINSNMNFIYTRKNSDDNKIF